VGPLPPEVLRGREELVPTAGRALDVACGRGAVALWLARRGLAVDAVDAARSGHPGAPLGLATLTWELFAHHLRTDPDDAAWTDRDRLVLSAGHASALLYSLLHLRELVTADELRRFRQWGSATPGHPEYGHTAGVETTTGPLGAGLATAVGLALAERVLAARADAAGGAGVVDHRTWVIAGDGCLMEGVSHEAASLAGRNDALISRSGIYAGGGFHDFDHLRVREDHTHSFYKGTGQFHPWDGVTDPIDPATGKAQDKYSWAKSPRYDVPGLGHVPLEVGPLARQVMAARPNPAAHQDADPFILNVLQEVGPNVLVRVLARVHELAKYYNLARTWLDELDLHDKFYAKPVEHESGKGFGSTEAARGALSDWIVIENGRIENYQVITPTAWNVGPRDKDSVVGPIEKAFIGTPVENTQDPVELGHVARSFDSCLVCTVHAYDGKTGQQLSKFTVGGM
jgi:transketolase N-terminal domain/subunit